MNIIYISLRIQEILLLSCSLIVLMALVYLILNLFNKKLAVSFKNNKLLIFGITILAILFIPFISRVVIGHLFPQQTKTELIHK